MYSNLNLHFFSFGVALAAARPPSRQNPAALTPAASNRCCNALALLQCVASHIETRALFLNAHVPLFLYPFLNTTHTHRPFEYLRLTSLGVVGALVKVNIIPPLPYISKWHSVNVFNFLILW